VCECQMLVRMTDISMLRAPMYHVTRRFIIDVAVIRGALAQTVPEHPKKENVFAVSTVVGDVFLFQASSINSFPFILCLASCGRCHFRRDQSTRNSCI